MVALLPASKAAHPAPASSIEAKALQAYILARVNRSSIHSGIDQNDISHNSDYNGDDTAD
jgi:hypothetical protein